NALNKRCHRTSGTAEQGTGGVRVPLRAVLVAGGTELHSPAADGAVLQHVAGGVVGEDVRDAEVGKIAGGYVDKLRDGDAGRHHRLWFAEDLNYLLVELFLFFEQEAAYEINLEKATINGKEVR